MKWNCVFQLGLSIALGVIAGFILGPRASDFGEVSNLLIQLLKVLAAPLLFFTIVNAFYRTEFQFKDGLKLVTVSLTNAIVAALIAISMSFLFSLGKSENIAHEAKVEMTSFTVSPLSTKGGFRPGLISLVVLSVIVGLFLRRLRKVHPLASLKGVEAFVNAGLKLFSKILSGVVKVVPVAVFCTIAKMVGTSGVSFFSTLSVFICLVLAGILFHSLIYYSLVLSFVVRKSPLLFYKQGGEAIATALATGSSLATLPVTLRTLQDKMKISTRSTMLAACVGSNLNHDGILLYEATAALFVAQISGIHLSLWQKASLLGTSAIAAFGIAGVPEAGLITLSLVLGSVGLPLTWVPLFMTVDWFIGRFRAATNVVSDMVVAHLLDC